MSQHYTMALLGSEGVGKTDLTLRFTQGRFEEDYDPTIEDFYKKNFEVDGVAVRLDILDTAGQAEYAHFLQEYLETREAFMLVFDVTNLRSYEFIVQLASKIYEEKGSDVPILYVGNKVDLKNAKQPQGFAPVNVGFRYSQYLETSAKLDVRVDEAFVALVRLIWKRNTDKRKAIGFSEVIFEPVITEPNESVAKKPLPKPQKKCPCSLF